MITIDARALREPYPTGVTEVTGQFVAHIKNDFPNTELFTGENNFSSALTNLALLTKITTVERCAGVYNEPTIVFLPNTHFVHTESTNVRVHVVHDLSFIHSPQWFNPRMRAWHRTTRAVAQLQKANILIAVSEWTRNDLINTLSIEPERVHVVHPATPAPHGGMRPQQLPFRSKPFFLFIGTLEKRKNVRGVIEAFEKIKNLPALHDHQLVLAGRAGFGAPDAHHLPQRVWQLPYISVQEKWWLLKHATALVYPSFFEGFGLPPLEAAAVGCPTIVSDCTAPPETMRDAALQVSPYDVSQIALAMEAIAIDRKLAATLKIRGFGRAAWYSTERQRFVLTEVLKEAHSLL